ncbi:hypothetical protein BDV12DRAFT_171924 [Aspergillus spectabilis]
MPSDVLSINHENVFLFIPNLIGYTRIILAFTSLYYMPYHPHTCTILYSISYLLDALDGAAARHLNQSTRFGTVLDMVTDRCTTTCLLVFLASVFPVWSIVFQALMCLDYSSHYVHMYATLVTGGGKSHKQANDGWPWVLRVYYEHSSVLFSVCMLNELCFIALYLLSFSSDTIPSVERWFSPHGAGVMNAIPSWPGFLFSVSSPFMLYKQYINVVQLVQGSKMIAMLDKQTRHRERVSQR